MAPVPPGRSTWGARASALGLRRGGERIQGARGYMSLRKDDLDQRFPGLLDSIIAADSEIVA